MTSFWFNIVLIILYHRQMCISHLFHMFGLDSTFQCGMKTRSQHRCSGRSPRRCLEVGLTFEHVGEADIGFGKSFWFSHHKSTETWVAVTHNFKMFKHLRTNVLLYLLNVGRSSGKDWQCPPTTARVVWHQTTKFILIRWLLQLDISALRVIFKVPFIQHFAWGHCCRTGFRVGVMRSRSLTGQDDHGFRAISGLLSDWLSKDIKTPGMAAYICIVI